MVKLFVFQAFITLLGSLKLLSMSWAVVTLLKDEIDQVGINETRMVSMLYRKQERSRMKLQIVIMVVRFYFSRCLSSLLVPL